jgi:hypothetical protein
MELLVPVGLDADIVVVFFDKLDPVFELFLFVVVE